MGIYENPNALIYVFATLSLFCSSPFAGRGYNVEGITKVQAAGSECSGNKRSCRFVSRFQLSASFRCARTWR